MKFGKNLSKLFIWVITLFIFSCSPNNVQDVDGNIYKTVKIGDQNWMAENLNVSRFRNGDKIPEAKTEGEWVKAGIEKKPVWCYYNYLLENGKKYGKLYNWYAVNDSRELAPNGWHIPSREEFEILMRAEENDGNSLKAQGQGMGEGTGNNKSGFSALLSGFGSSENYEWKQITIDMYESGFSRDYKQYLKNKMEIENYNSFNTLGKFTEFWSSTKDDFWTRRASSLSLAMGDNQIRIGTSDMSDIYSVRCIKND